MENFIKSHRFLSGLLSVFISVFLVSLVAYGATTIGTNIQTAGTASSTSATTTDYLYVGPDFTEDANMNFTAGDLFVANDVNVGGVTYLDGALQATTTSLFTGAATFYSTVNVTGLATFDKATSTSATTTDYLYIGPDGVEGTFDFTGGDLYVADDVEIGGLATTTEALNTQGTLHVGGNADVDGTFTFGTSTTPISVILFGTCNVDFSTSLAGDEASSTDCAATGVVSGDKVFVTPRWLEPGIVFTAASTTDADTIRIFVHNASTTAAVTTGENVWQWMTIH